MFRVKIDRTEPTDLHDQVAAEIRRAIAEGEAEPGERLPPARDLAAVLEVNRNTVLRALRQLRDEGQARQLAELARASMAISGSSRRWAEQRWMGEAGSNQRPLATTAVTDRK